MKGRMLSNMLMLATYKHAGQVDKSGQPYILHPLAVMHMLYTDDEELQCIALGHDLVEDTDITCYELENLGFSDRIVRAIHTLTRPEGMLYSEYKEQVKTNPDAIRVKLCDLRHNMDPSRKFALPLSLKKRYVDFHAELQRLLP
jgi:GTP diphosphokinase / guanosine-3',5'-bis(diphosphate) 3'-diphosphatase